MKKPAILLDIYIQPRLSERKLNALKPDLGDPFWGVSNDFEYSTKTLKRTTKVKFIFYNARLKKNYRKISRDMEELLEKLPIDVELKWNAKQVRCVIPPLPQDIEDSLKEMKS